MIHEFQGLLGPPRFSKTDFGHHSNAREGCSHASLMTPNHLHSYQAVVEILRHPSSDYGVHKVSSGISFATLERF